MEQAHSFRQLIDQSTKRIEKLEKELSDSKTHAQLLGVVLEGHDREIKALKEGVANITRGK
jgi:hypothetical protein